VLSVQQLCRMPKYQQLSQNIDLSSQNEKLGPFPFQNYLDYFRGGHIVLVYATVHVYV
jgi:hypothetical protein